MPDVTWEEINDIIHECKNTLALSYKIELTSKKLRKEIGKELARIEDIILKQIDNE